MHEKLSLFGILKIRFQRIFMILGDLAVVTKDDLVMTKHAQDEAMDDGISRIEIAEAISRGPRIPEGDHFVTVYRYFTVVYEPLPDGRFKVITVHIGRPKDWKGK